ncbi:Vegetative incompatibility HET-E-1 [Pyrenophora seminiperda CCB06]|uniref:Vegetative incompatibility HET-E-1 n=1 Tax=Pyrenophora seminiperda CCB06 TaxID=1302712 RepID=A0A3M7LVT1_9PLEO|nr:Vegetative incompatibility HET-E-1 [Pyrenophora seminiperda CCB06]
MGWSHDNTIKIWDASSGACLQTLEGCTVEQESPKPIKHLDPASRTIAGAQAFRACLDNLGKQVSEAVAAIVEAREKAKEAKGEKDRQAHAYWVLLFEGASGAENDIKKAKLDAAKDVEATAKERVEEAQEAERKARHEAEKA